MNHGRTPSCPRLDRVAVTLSGRLLAVCRWIGFWGAVVLPVLYAPLLAAGIDSRSRGLVFVGLLVLHLLALVVGHGYDAPTVTNVDARSNTRLIADGGSDERPER